MSGTVAKRYTKISTDKTLYWGCCFDCTGSFSTEKREYIQPGAHSCKIVSITTSDLLDNYNGSPFITFNVVSDGKQGRVQMWAVKETDKPSTQEWKKKQMKDFLVNAGVKDFSDDSKAMNDAIGKTLMITFISEEYIGKNKQTQEPVIRTSVKYRWSNKSGAKCIYNADMNKTISNEDKVKYTALHSTWEQNNNTVTIEEEDDNLPF